MSDGPESVVHVVKLCVGAASIDDLRDWQAGQIATRRAVGMRPLPHCGTRAFPKKRVEILAGGSLYWVIRGTILVRQRILDIGDVVDDHGPRCGLFLDPELHATVPVPRRAFQGWRYLHGTDAPPDLAAHLACHGADCPANCVDGLESLPAGMRQALIAAGVW